MAKLVTRPKAIRQPKATTRPEIDDVSFTRLTKDLRDAAGLLDPPTARYLVDLYYMIQKYRIRSGNQVREFDDSGEPNLVVQWMLRNQLAMEKDIVKAMDAYSSSHLPGRWAKSICGIGPVLAAGLLAHIDIEKAPHVGHVWSFAGLNPKTEWKKNTKRPWNADLKTLCWKMGESFVKVKGRDADVYGKLYEHRKDEEIAKNVAGEFAGQAAAKLEKFKIGKTTEAYGHYSKGRLPPGHIHARAKRYAVKMFLSHYHHVAFFDHTGQDPPRPWIIEHGGHADMMNPPNWPVKP